ncbi:MAG: sulfite dehydrogenase [Chloroflexi bacterium]|nr:sulfite dehydrogenase [Chloroflexota bacterium]
MELRTRRRFLKIGAILGPTFAALQPSVLFGQLQDAARTLGHGVSAYGARSRFETAIRLLRDSRHSEASSSRTPLRDLHGTITPSALHFERHHAGVPDIDPSTHRLLIHGLVERPLEFSLDDLKQLPVVSRIYSLECSGNSRTLWGEAGATTVQSTHGMTSCSEWVGIPLSLLLQEVGVRPEATWLVAEGADASRLNRSLPLTKALDNTLVAFGQNGEALRPGQGYPLRLFVPGWEGNISVKWLHRIELVDQPYMTREETSKYTDLLPDGTARQFTFIMEAKSVITNPSGGQQLSSVGSHQIEGIAWSGRGRVDRVEVSTNGGKDWHRAELQSPILPLAHTRFRFNWAWDGGEAVLQSRCIDETGYTQPTRDALIAKRGLQSSYHNNAIQSWKVAADGTVENVYV